MTRQSHFLRHCSEWFPAAWKWLPTCRSTSKCTRDRAAAAEFLGSSSFLKSVKQLRLSMLFMFLAVVTFDFPIPLVAVSSSTSADPPALQMGSNSSSLVHGRFLQTSKRRAGRFSTGEETEPANARRLSGQYLCRWKKDICEQEPISYLLGPDCCNSVCTNMKTDAFNCGTCGQICFYGSICCNGVCTDIFSNNRNCGACDNICPSGEVCQYGLCGYT
ncbi:hypothetical protein M758_1G034000 [Ceratodon purpureus]|nr:hypothetical protein M758_1G034000 [Ceratodon purpureus]